MFNSVSLETGIAQQTADLTPILEELAELEGWGPLSSVVLLMSRAAVGGGVDNRVAFSSSDSDNAPTLHLTVKLRE